MTHIVKASELFNRDEIRDLYNYTDKTIFIELQKHVIKVLAEIIIDYYTELRMEIIKYVNGSSTIEQMYTHVIIEESVSYLHFYIRFDNRVLREYTFKKKSSSKLKLSNLDDCELHDRIKNCESCKFRNQIRCQQYIKLCGSVSLWNIICNNIVYTSPFYKKNYGIYLTNSFLRSVKLDNNIFPSKIPFTSIIKDTDGSITNYKVINKLYENDIMYELNNVEKIIERMKN
jgi:hypothetical protein